MKIRMPEEEKTITNFRNLFSMKKEQNQTAIIDIRNLFRLKKKLKELKI